MAPRREAFAVIMGRLLLLWALLAGCNRVEWGANALLHPAKRVSRGIPDGTESFEAVAADSVILKGWWSRGVTPRRGLILWLHGVGDNKDSAEGLVERWAARGFDVAAYDSRAHGASGGQSCTYGFREKEDVHNVLEALARVGADVDRTILMGVSMGGAVALQAAPLDGRIRAVVALAPFADLRQAARRAAPFWMGQKSIDGAFQRAESEGQFRLDEVSPRGSAERIHVPLLLIHGTEDRKLPLADGQAIEQAAGTSDKNLLQVEGANHDNLLDRKETWAAIDQFLDRVSPAGARK
jgi:alpha-beta hydrolase superfamily lysophospholipase